MPNSKLAGRDHIYIKWIQTGHKKKRWRENTLKSYQVVITGLQKYGWCLFLWIHYNSEIKGLTCLLAQPCHACTFWECFTSDHYTITISLSFSVLGTKHARCYTLGVNLEPIREGSHLTNDSPFSPLMDCPETASAAPWRTLLWD